MTYDTRHGDRITFEHWYCRLVGNVWDGGGFSIVTFLQSVDTDHKEALAIGSYEGEVCFVALPSQITPEFFIQEPEPAKLEEATA